MVELNIVRLGHEHWILRLKEVFFMKGSLYIIYYRTVCRNDHLNSGWEFYRKYFENK